MTVEEEDNFFRGFCLMLLCTLFVFIYSCARTIPGYAYTDKEIVDAIYMVEGGSKTKHPYGIRSVRCGSKESCRAICENTVKHNRIRFIRHEHPADQDFIQFLGARYCPAEGDFGCKRNARFNKAWVKNVKYYLKRNHQYAQRG